MRSYSVLLRHEPLSGNDRPYSSPPKAPYPKFLSTLGNCWGSPRLPYLRFPYSHLLYSHLPYLLQVWLTQDQLGAFLAVLSAALAAASSATLPTALYLLHKIRIYDAHRVARKTAVFLAPKPLPLTPHSQSVPVRLMPVRPTRRLHTRAHSKQRDLNCLKPTPSTASFCAKPYTYY